MLKDVSYKAGSVSGTGDEQKVMGVTPTLRCVTPSWCGCQRWAVPAWPAELLLWG